MSGQVGVRTRSQAALAMEGASSAQSSAKKRKKINNTHEEAQVSKTCRTSAVKADIKQRCLSPTSSEIPASCCSSNGSIALDDDRIKLLDLEVESAQVETFACNAGAQEIERREMNRSSELLRENSQDPEQMEINSHRALSTAKAMPTDLELEEFFAAAEKDIQKRFQDKYNYDIVKDVPLEGGRYEWVQLKP